MNPVVSFFRDLVLFLGALWSFFQQQTWQRGVGVIGTGLNLYGAYQGL